MRVEVDGRPVHVATGGCGDVPRLVLVHGAQHDHFVWQALLDGLGMATLAPDLPGHGRSEGPPLPSIEAMADWLLALLEKVGVTAGNPRGTGGTVNLAGHSMGALVALAAALRRPDRVGHLLLLGAAVPMPVAPALLQAARADEPKALALINRWSHSRRALLGACGGHGLWLPAINLRVMERQRRGVLANDLTACDAYHPAAAALARLERPVTLIAGDQDRMTPLKAARHLAAQFGDARLVVLPGVGHALMAEAPLACRAALMGALAAG